ncbi:hypothetical protein OJAV_G00124080 [Oryzias javanicus]|uniref:Uncharacterized protein n=1 Tax=Oryzias javanicus TaxID=123683 RepID=A0A437CUW1_ORYJA|nr:hypothetical protein OJAV_G00124080 [Oryzias javanicus]
MLVSSLGDVAVQGTSSPKRLCVPLQAPALRIGWCVELNELPQALDSKSSILFCKSLTGVSRESVRCSRAAIFKIPGLQMSLKKSKGFWEMVGTSELPVGDAMQRRHNKTFVSERFDSDRKIQNIQNL